MKLDFLNNILNWVDKHVPIIGTLLSVIGTYVIYLTKYLPYWNHWFLWLMVCLLLTVFLKKLWPTIVFQYKNKKIIKTIGKLNNAQLYYLYTSFIENEIMESDQNYNVIYEPNIRDLIEKKIINVRKPNQRYVGGSESICCELKNTKLYKEIEKECNKRMYIIFKMLQDTNNS